MAVGSIGRTVRRPNAIGRPHAQRLGEQPQRGGPASGQLPVAQNRRQEVVERVARRQHEAGDAVGVLGGDPLGDRAARVVRDQRDVLQAEGREEVGDDPGEPRERHVHAADEPGLVRAWACDGHHRRHPPESATAASVPAGGAAGSRTATRSPRIPTGPADTTPSSCM